tara:strand:+ start:1577 stop:2497 length:921 start_codon:yes stop_codon:yes gene_type:complete
MKVVYGHTDSIYVQIPTIEESEKICKMINTHVQSIFPNIMGLENHPVQLEFEKYYKTLGVGCVKNRNAGYISWKDGKYLDEPQFIVTGFTMKRISETKLEKEVQGTVIKMWVNESPKKEIVKYITNKFNEVKGGQISIEAITKRTRVKEERLKVKHKCGKQYQLSDLIIIWKNHDSMNNGVSPLCDKCGYSMFDTMFTTLEGKRISIGSGLMGLLEYNQNNPPIEDSYIFMRCLPEGKKFFTPFGKEKPLNYASAKELVELKNHTPDYVFYSDAVIRKAKPIFDAMDWDINECRQDNNQKMLDDWW